MFILYGSMNGYIKALLQLVFPLYLILVPVIMIIRQLFKGLVHHTEHYTCTGYNIFTVL